jgi:hypothetical protein
MRTIRDILTEASYPGNIGAIEMVTFFQKATDKDIKKMQKIVDVEDWESYKKLIKNVLGVTLK